MKSDSRIADFLRSVLLLLAVFLATMAAIHCQTAKPMDVIMGGNVIQEDTCQNEYGYFNLAISFTEGIVMFTSEHEEYEEKIICWDTRAGWLTVWTDKAQYECAWMPLITARSYAYILKTPYKGVVQAMWRESALKRKIEGDTVVPSLPFR